MKLPVGIEDMRQTLNIAEREVADVVWRRRKYFVCWASKRRPFPHDCARRKYHTYTQIQQELLNRYGVHADTRSNGPAICGYLLAQGERPKRRGGKQWTIHHIYDGQFPFPGRSSTLHAVKDAQYFTDYRGLVAIHPIADGLASELPYFAWLLRYEAFLKFKFDPDKVFRRQ